MDRWLARIGDNAMTVFAVVGEHRDNPDRLLVIGEDGLHYDMRLPEGTAVPVEPDDRWLVDENGAEPEELLG